jgi:hypothetical protein
MCLSLQVDQLYKQAAAALKLSEDKFKLVQKGTTITNSAAAAAARQDGSSTEVSTNSSSGLFGARQRPSAVVHLSAGGELLQKPNDTVSLATHSLLCRNLYPGLKWLR